ncbi:hypothetical protein K1719_017374 [Acacia pycnantha]|nr:hypothetical protein K1719_017374 [Acacia pycnantha]
MDPEYGKCWDTSKKNSRKTILLLANQSLGVVYGDLSISPLYYAFVVLRADDNREGGTFALYSLICRHAKVSLLPNRQIADEALSTYIMEQPPRRNSSRVKKLLEKYMALHIALLIVVLLGTCMVIGDGLLTPAISGKCRDVFDFCPKVVPTLICFPGTTYQYYNKIKTLSMKI